MTRIKLALAALAVAAVAVVPAAQAATTLTGIVGPQFNISLTVGGKKVTKLKHGSYVVKISDRSSIHNFRLKGPGLNKTTSIGGKGSYTWKVTLKPGKYTYVCDPHATLMRGSFTVS